MKNIKYISRIILSMGLACLIAGCSLETHPYESNDVSKLKEEDIKAMTLGSYANLKKSRGIMAAAHFLGEYGGDNTSISGATTDNMYYYQNYQRGSNNSHSSTIWASSYKGIVNINTSLELYESLSNKPEEADIQAGENYYLRALHYLILVSTFGQPYVNNPTVNLGVPLKLTSSSSDYPERATVYEVYKRIETDLLTAVDLMTLDPSSKIKPKSSIFATKEAAEALLSRVYLYMENWTEAEKYATKVIEAKDNSGVVRFELLQGESYQVYPTYTPETNKETIFAVKHTKDIDDFKGNSVGAMYIKINNVGWGEIYASASYMDLLDQQPNDRRHAFIEKGQRINEAGEPTHWFIYVNEKNATTYEYAKILLKEEANGTYTITESPEKYKSATVQQENFNGGVRYYVETVSDNKKVVGRVDPRLTDRNGYPQYFVGKCSRQEGQAQLWSPVVSRLSEMYLNRAEARSHLGAANALDDINVLRTRANIPVWTSVPADKTELDLILEERRLELAFEGHRRFDIIRNRQSINKRFPGGHLLGSANLLRMEIPYNDNAVAEFIPESEMNSYPTPLIQNP